MARKSKDKIVSNTLDLTLDDIINDREFSDILSDGMEKYSIKVIEDRALPDARDGLKPSQRRILYAMLKLNLLSDKGFAKCALISGYTSGHYHPHGEAVIYPTLVRMAQNWLARYPLVRPQGNFGDVDGEKVAAMRYCVTGENLLPTDNGLVKIRTLHDKAIGEDISINVLSRGSDINHASKFYDCGVHSTITIETQHGYEEAGSQNHPVYCLLKDQSGKPYLDFKLLKDVKNGDYVVIDRSTIFWPSELINLTTYHPELSKKEKFVDFPTHLDNKLAMVLGALTAEGSIGKDKVCFTNNSGEFIDKVTQNITEIFGSEAISLYDREAKGWSVAPYIQAEMFRQGLVRFFHNIGLIPGSGRTKEIPHVILRSPREVVASYLAGLFEGDGGVENCDDFQRVSLTTTSNILRKQVQVVLLRFGIASNYFFDGKRGTYRVVITGERDIRLFAARVGFVTTKKNQLLNEAMLRAGKGTTHLDFIPYVSSYLRGKYNSQWIRSNNFDRISRLPKALGKLQTLISSEDYNLIQSLYSSGYLFSKIIDVRDSGDQNVYSIRVDSDCHSFVGNGFVNHNTEARLQPAGDYMVNEGRITEPSDDHPDAKLLVPFIDNYANTRKEPVVLPTMLPNLLLNGASGIAVSVATNMPPHNLREVADVIKAYIANPKINVDEVMKLMPGPDFPMPCTLLGQSGVKNYYENGRGSMRLEGKYAIEQEGNKTLIHITELPYGGSPMRFTLQVKELRQSKQIEGVTRCLNNTKTVKGITQIDIVLELDKSANPQVVVNKLLKATCLRETFSVNANVLVNGKVEESVPILRLVEIFVNHRKTVLTNRFQGELAQYQKQLHLIDGRIMIVPKIKAAVDLIMEAESPSEAINLLVELKYVETEEQAKDILEIKLQQLTKLDRDKLINLRADVLAKVTWLLSALDDERIILQEVVKEQDIIVKKLGDDRRTTIGFDADEIFVEDLIPVEQIMINLTADGYIKRVPVTEYSVQKRGGKGVNNTHKRTEDAGSIYVASTHDLLMFFTKSGSVYKKKGYEIPEAQKTGKGLHLANLLSLEQGDTVVGTIPLQTLDADGTVVIVTKQGLIKRVSIRDLDTRLKNRGLPVISLNDGDEVAFVEATDGDRDIQLFTSKGLAIRYNESLVRTMGRAAQGVRAMLLNADDNIAKMITLDPKQTPMIMVITELGYGKKTDSSDYRAFSGRNAKGVQTISQVKKDRNGLVIGAEAVTDDDILVVQTTKGKIILMPVKDFKEKGRGAMGNTVVKLDVNDTVCAITKVSNEVFETDV